MQLFRLNTSDGVTLDAEIRPIKFKDIVVGGNTAKEQDLEDLIVRYPQLLNFGDCQLDEGGNADLLVIARQPTTETRKRADLFAVHRDGSLAVIEVKRDAQDERGRAEAVEFQAIRYAAASRKMDSDAVVRMLAEYLRREAATGMTSEMGDTYWQEQATERLCRHLSSEDDDVDSNDLPQVLDPRERQKVLIVAADFDPDVTSACAWLREHEIDIYCFRLRPYKIGDEVVMERERLIPPPELDDFMVEMSLTTGPGAGPRKSRSQGAAKPVSMIWENDVASATSVRSWRSLLHEVVRIALSAGLDPTQLPMTHTVDEAESQTYYSREHFPAQGIWADLHGSSQSIKAWVTAILRRQSSLGRLSVTTADGASVTFP